MTNKTDPANSFYDDLRKFREKYPMVYVEAWTPEDFRVDWKDGVAIAERLADDFDADHGTNWDSIESSRKRAGFPHRGR